MTDLSQNVSHVSGRTPLYNLTSSVLVFVRFSWLMFQYWWRADTGSAEAVLRTKEVVSFRHGFETDGTTFVVTQGDGSVRRVPASSIVCFRDSLDNGYSH